MKQKRKKGEMEKNPQDYNLSLWDTMKQPNVYVLGVPKVLESQNLLEQIFS